MGAKKIETRRWSTAYRGELLIHASSGKAGGLLAQDPPFTRFIPNFQQLPFGAIIGKVVLEEVVPVKQLLLTDAALNQLTLEERAFGDYGAGRYAWVLSDPVAFLTPIPAKGHLHLWDYNGPLGA